MPTLSVVIPCRNDDAALQRCLASLARQSLPPMEVIVVDNACSDNSAGTAARYGSIVVVESRVSIGAAAAAGYDAARGQIIVRCDADSRPPSDWLARIAAHFAADPDLDALTGPGVFYGISRPRAAVAQALYMTAYFLLMGAAMAHWPLFGSNMAMRRTLWCDVRNGVHRTDPQVHDDVDLSFLLGSRRIRCDPRLRVGISPRALYGVSNAELRLHRALHTLRVHWQQESPGRRWQRRLQRRS
ncbi:glycosyltransferase family 2 protein [Paenarthrobacter sp. Z7-10]|nr:glycosyltransferase family 2 protein [Paenarthrobacter sp. Z7-10]